MDGAAAARSVSLHVAHSCFPRRCLWLSMGEAQPDRQSMVVARLASALESLVEHGLGRLSRSELVRAWLAIGEVDRWWGKGGLRSGWTGVCGSWVFGWHLIWAMCGGDSRGRFGMRGKDYGVRPSEAWTWERGKCESEIWKMWVCRVGFSNFWFYTLISFSLIRYLLSLIIGD